MKRLFAEILAFIISMNAFSTLDGKEKNSFPMGQEIVSEVEAEYNKGAYKNFLEQLHTQYQAAGKVGAIRPLFQNATKAIGDSISNTFEKQKRNQRLLEAVAQNPNLAVTKKVQSIVNFSQSPEQTKIFEELNKRKHQFPDKSGNTLEDKISTIETEFYLKSLLLDIANQRSQTPLLEKYKKKIVLSLEKLRKLENVVNNSDDIVWKEKLQKIKAVYHTHLAVRMDLESLSDLAKGKIAPSNPTEEKVKDIMSDYIHKK